MYILQYSSEAIDKYARIMYEIALFVLVV